MQALKKVGTACPPKAPASRLAWLFAQHPEAKRSGPIAPIVDRQVSYYDAASRQFSLDKLEYPFHASLRRWRP